MELSNTKKVCGLIFLLCIATVFFTCSSAEDVEEVIIENPDPEDPEEPIIDPNKIVAINTGSLNGQMYNFWSTRTIINQTRINRSGFPTNINQIKDNVKI